MKYRSFELHFLHSLTSILTVAALTLALAPAAQATVTNIAYYRFGENDLGAADGVTSTATTNLLGGVLKLQTNGVYTASISVTAASRVGSLLGLQFAFGNYGTNSIATSLTDNFGIELWVKPDDTGSTKCLAYNGSSSTSGWGIFQVGGSYRGLFGGITGIDNGTATAGVWAHLALVRDNGVTTFYVNGIPSVTSASAPNPPTGFFCVGYPVNQPLPEYFAGTLDEVRVFSFAPGGFSTNDLLLNHSFTEQIPIAGLPGAQVGSVAWGDYDNDGRLDFLLTGRAGSGGVSQLWRNTGSGFANVTASIAPGLPGVYVSSVAWGDYDNDGRLDFLLTGDAGSGGVSQLWRNTGSGFANVTASLAPGLPGVSASSVAWGDYDNDGRLDFLLTGDAGSGAVSQLWRNTATGFANVTASVAPGLPGVQIGSVAWGDYDNDGRLDFLLTGDAGSGAVSQLWRNTGSGFTNMTASLAPGLPGAYYSSVAWGDYDNDGQLDFLLTGLSSGSVPSQLWRNTGSGFTNVTASVAPGLPAVQAGSVAWGDYDNDGRLDFLLTGYDGNNVSQLWRNTGSGFTNMTASVAPGLPGVSASSAAWGDYDNDGRLDFLLMGYTGGEVISQLWRNKTPITNTPPVAPTSLSVAAVAGGLSFSWEAASDVQTPASGLGYHLRIGTSPGGSELLAPMTAPNGRPLLPRSSALLPARSRIVTGLPTGQVIYWSVQAADAGFAGSPFSAGQALRLGVVLVQTNGVFTPGDINGDGVVNQAEFAAVLTALQPNQISRQNAAGYYTPAQVQALNSDTPLLSRTNGQFKLTLGLQRATQLTNFLAFPMTGPQTTINGDGKLEFLFTSPDDAAFFRLEAH